MNTPASQVYDYVIIGSGFGGSVSAMRLAEKGYSVLMLERGKRFEDKDFPKTNMNLGKSLWAPFLRCFGILEFSFLNGAIIFRGSGVGGGSLMYANVLMEPDEKLFEAPSWHHLLDWKKVLRPFYVTAKYMLGVTTNPRFWNADEVLKRIAAEENLTGQFRPTEVGVFFGANSDTVSDPYFDGRGPARSGCIYCGGCMVGCRYNAKNTLPKNYLYFAEKMGVRILPESTVLDIRPINAHPDHGAHYDVVYRKATAWFSATRHTVKARNVIIAAGALGTLKLLFRCREQTRSLPRLSHLLGDGVRTNSENIQGVISREKEADYSKGVAITSILTTKDGTNIEPVRFSDGSSFYRFICGPLVEGANNPVRIKNSLLEILRHPFSYLYAGIFSRWARHTTILLYMQLVDQLLHVRLGRNIFTLFRQGVMFRANAGEQLPKSPSISNGFTRTFASRVRGIPLSTFMESLFNFPTTAHFMGGVPIGMDENEGVVDLNFRVHNYPGLYVVDGSILPANPGVNPSLTITALAEYAMSKIPPKAA